MTKVKFKHPSKFFSEHTSYWGKRVAFMFTTIGGSITGMAVALELSKAAIITSALLVVIGTCVGGFLKAEDPI